MDYKLDVRSAKKMRTETLSMLYDFLTSFHLEAKDIAEITFNPGKQRVSFAVIQHWADGAPAQIDGQTVVDDIAKPCTPEKMLPFLAYATPQVKISK
jgi:hypothetical protein